MKGLTTGRLITLITFMGVFAMAARLSMDPDTWWHLRAGEWILAHLAVPQVDPFSYTRLGAPWQYPGWLVQVPMALIFRWFGPGGLNLWTAIMVTLAYIFVWKSLSGSPFLKAFAIVLSAAASGVYWAARPYLVTFLLAAVFLWILDDNHWRPSPTANRRLWALPVLMVIWANSHGGFAVGLLIWGVYLAGELVGAIKWRTTGDRQRTSDDERRRTNDEGETNSFRLSSFVYRPSSSLYRLLSIGALMLLAVCLNPSGPVMLLYPFKTVGIGALQEYIYEWQSPDFHTLQVQPFAWLLLITFGVIGAGRRRLALTDFLLVAGFAYLGLLSGRNIALFALAAPLTLTRHASLLLVAWGRRLGLSMGPELRPSRMMTAANLLILALLLLAVLAKLSLVFPVEANREDWERGMPVRAVDFIREARPPGRLFNSYNWGGYLLWALPEYPVFIDGRTDLYDDEVIDQWLKVARAEPGWQAVLDLWKVRLVLMEPSMPVVRVLEGSGWRLLYQDKVAVLYGR